jgi:hypothetical protein
MRASNSLADLERLDLGSLLRLFEAFDFLGFATLEALPSHSLKTSNIIIALL